jgi:hypothetical protein
MVKSTHLSRDNLWVGILGLDQKLDTFNGGSGGLGDGTRYTSGKKVDDEIGGHGEFCCAGKDFDV